MCSIHIIIVAIMFAYYYLIYFGAEFVCPALQLSCPTEAQHCLVRKQVIVTSMTTECICVYVCRCV